ncbi:DUF3592 domain-containing protein [Streptomyces klenkii]|uniref:DUF3592 domain-containing protein n=1 Tax=Streptomyces klenkii TaxID=1420899 RepID=UPI0036E7AA61
MSGEVAGGVLCALAGLVCLWAGVREWRLLSRLRRYGVHAEGVVVGRERLASDDPWTPVIEYADGQGLRTRFRPQVTGTGLGLDIGAHVPVVYLPEQPETARVFTKRHRAMAVVGLLIGGTVFLGVAVLIALTR